MDNIPDVVEVSNDSYILPIFIIIPIGLALFLLILVCIYKQVKIFLIRRKYKQSVNK